LISCYLKNQTRLSNPDQLLLQDLSDSSAADRGEYRQAAAAIAGLNTVRCTLEISRAREAHKAKVGGRARQEAKASQPGAVAILLIIRTRTSALGHKRTHALQQVGEIQGEKFCYAARSTRMSISLGSVLKSIVFVGPPTRAWWVMAGAVRITA
jgi:hypothetical protein